MKLFKGLMGVTGSGVLYSPSGRRLIKLPKCIAFFIHTNLNRFGCKISKS